VNRALLDILACPKCQSSLGLRQDEGHGDRALTGLLTCEGCAATYAIRGGVPRFVDDGNYAASFGLQWNRFRTTQLDSTTGVGLSAERFYSETGWTREWLQGKLLLGSIQWSMPVLFSVTEVLFRLPLVGRLFRILIPVSNDTDELGLSNRQRYRPARLDTFDVLSPEFEYPQTAPDVVHALGEVGMVNLHRRPTPGLTIAGTMSQVPRGVVPDSDMHAG
jgi:uncharacterized protein YbaR (Trm112 family)